MNSKNSRRGLEGFFSGKGFYIVLFLCAAVIGGSAWMMAVGNRNLAADVTRMNRESLERQRVETVILPPKATEALQETMGEAEPAMEEENSLSEEIVQVWREDEAEESVQSVEAAEPVWLWPVTGPLERGHDAGTLSYDVTMRDWRAHQGIDIASPLGTTVTAAHEGTVESVEQDDFYGTVVTVSHGDGLCTVYANLADVPAVSVGDWVEAGAVIGSVGDTALCEVGEGTHLHFAVTVGGESGDPLSFLPQSA